MSARLATYNLLHGVNLGTGVADPADLVAATRRLAADLVGLQEVDRCQERSGDLDQTELVAETLSAEHWRFVPALHGTPGAAAPWEASSVDDGTSASGPTYGIGMVSRWPVRRWWVKRFAPAPLSLPLLVPGEGRARLVRVPDEPRLALAALVDGPGGVFTAVTCHLSFVPGYNLGQLRAVTRWVARMPQPVIVLGDLNLPGPLPRWATGWTPLVRAATYPSYRPRVQFDHVLGLGLGPADVRAAHVTALDVSDHCAVAVDVDLEGATRRAAAAVSRSG